MLPFPPLQKQEALPVVSALTAEYISYLKTCMTRSRSAAGNSLRIIAGQWRSRRLSFPDAEGLRPTPDRIRETLFNWLQDTIVRADCLDLFAGSGACGMEALSRGARHVSFVDSSALVTRAIRSNLELLKAEDYQVYCESALDWLRRMSAADYEPVTSSNRRQFDVVFLDPPFASDLLVRSVVSLEQSGLLKPGCLIYLESAQPVAAALLPASWQQLKARKAGAVHFYLYRRGEA